MSCLALAWPLIKLMLWSPLLPCARGVFSFGWIQWGGRDDVLVGLPGALLLKSRTGLGGLQYHGF